MKKLFAGLMVLAVAAAVAQADGIKSANAVGFINKDMTGGKLYAMTIPFENMDSDDGAWVFAETQLAKDADYGSQVFFWDGAKQGWGSYNKNKLTKKWTCGDKAVKSGEFFFFQPAVDMTCVTSGEVPDADLPVTILASQSLSAVALPYPVPKVFAETKLAQDADYGSQVFFWDESKQGWGSYNKNKLTKKWTCGDRSVEPGEGFFFQTTSGTTSSQEWVEPLPYDLSK